MVLWSGGRAAGVVVEREQDPMQTVGPLPYAVGRGSKGEQGRG